MSQTHCDTCAAPLSLDGPCYRGRGVDKRSYYCSKAHVPNRPTPKRKRTIMTDHIITASEVLEALNWAVEKYGENHRAESTYSENDEPNCLLGVIVHRIDPIAYRAIADRAAGFGALATNSKATLRRPVTVASFDLIRIMRSMQEEQDTASTWGSIRRWAVPTLKEMSS